MIVLQDVNKSFGSVRAVERVSLTINDESQQVLFGPSGCGKTTLLRLIAGLETPDEGQIHLDQRLVSTCRHVVPPWERNIGYVFQEPTLWPHMTVQKNVQFGLGSKLSDEEKAQLESLLVRTGISAIRKSYPDQISGGQARRVAIARALVCRPRYLLMDEPLTNLDHKAAFELLDLIKELVAEYRATLLYVTHNREEAACLEANMIYMNEGRIVVEQ